MYVDDIILTGNCLDEIDRVRNYLKSKFLINDLGKLLFLLGLEVVDVNKGICLFQRKYFIELLHEFGMLSCKLVNTPLNCNVIVMVMEWLIMIAWFKMLFYCKN